ncbi:hypothetical protein RJT34_16100 [Clitoria ternatea]|uniref:TF-B3 domain-containing protein n=1 Tax=Clitoria ternatea TaxID=43366 RepID=A0AAN9PDC2_CLITE
MHPSYVHPDGRGSLNLPAKFCKAHFDLQVKMVDAKLVFKERIWPVKYLIRKLKTSTKFELSSGWKAFAKDNDLKVDDVCIFELIHGTELTFQVHIFRHIDTSSNSMEPSPLKSSTSFYEA